MGVNGPSILLEILTKEPKPPSQAAQGAKHPVPPTLDRVMTHAFKKQAGQRIGSVGALADAVGQAYGLTGVHQEWARASEADLTTRISAKLPELMAAAAAPAKPATVADSFFGEADALDSFDAPSASIRPAPGVGLGLQQGYGPNSAPHDVPMGVPKSGGNMMLFLAVGGGALVLGVLIAVVLVLLR
jgi:serine/threonine-protein kinase